MRTVLALAMVSIGIFACDKGGSAQALGERYFDMLRTWDEQLCECMTEGGWYRDIGECNAEWEEPDDATVYCNGKAFAESSEARQYLECYEAAVDEYIACVAREGCAHRSPNYICEDGTAVHPTKLCDHMPQCSNDEDERDCPDPVVCDGGYEVPESLVCNGLAECADEMDEQECPAVDVSLFFTCESGRRIPADWRCNLASECGDGSDERDCPETCLSRVHATCGEPPHSLEEIALTCYFEKTGTGPTITRMDDNRFAQHVLP